MIKNFCRLLFISVLAFLSHKAISQTTITYEYDDSGNRVELLSPISCDVLCECPEDSDTWFNMSVGEIGGVGTSCPDGCLVNSSLNIPQEYNCYTYYEVKVTSNLHTYPEGPMQIINRSNLEFILTEVPDCIDVDETMTVEILLYRYAGDEYPCVLSQTIYGCEVDCCEKIDVSFESVGISGCYFNPVIELKDQNLCDLSEYVIKTFVTSDNVSWFEQNNPNNQVILSTYHEKKIGVEIWVDGVKCKDMEIFEVECLCDACPVDSEKEIILNLEIVKDDPACGPGMCSAIPTLDMSKIDDACFSHFKISANRYHKDGSTIETYTNSGLGEPIPLDGILKYGQLPCLEPGEKLSVKVELYRTASMTDTPCELVSQVEACPLIDRNRDNVCTNVDEIPNSGDVRSTIITMPNGCKYEVNYKYYKTFDGYQDVQILDAMPVDGNCSGTNTESEIFREGIAKAIGEILKTEDDYFPVRNSTQNCFDFWRVVNNSCWSKWEIADIHTQEIWELFLPCESSCCGRKLRVCRYGENIIIKDLGFAYGSSKYNCSQDAEVPSPQDIILSGNVINNIPTSCYDNDCDIFVDWDIKRPVPNEPYDDRIIDHESRETLLNKKAEELVSSELIVFKVEITNDFLLLQVKDSKVENVRFQIADMNGKVIFNEDINLNGLMTNYMYNTNKLITGTYVYKIYSSEGVNAFKSGTFQIVR